MARAATEQYRVPWWVAGDWNAFVLRVQGRNIKLSINGKEAWATEATTPPEGYIGIQAEGVRYQFRNIKLTPLKG